LASKLNTQPTQVDSDRKSIKSFKGNDDGPSPVSSPALVSPTESYWGGDSAPPSRPASKPASRAPSMSAGVSGNKVQQPTTPGRERRGSKPEVPITPGRTSRAGSIHSEKGDSSHKFTLKDLLSSGPKLSRKSSQRSTSSKRSDSDAGEGRARSTAGDSAASLSQKYGVCQKLAIGKGATSVVRLAHKWDRTEEKLYAVKVCLPVSSAGVIGIHL
jgi:protein-serine/threonine kinase